MLQQPHGVANHRTHVHNDITWADVRKPWTMFRQLLVVPMLRVMYYAAGILKRFSVVSVHLNFFLVSEIMLAFCSLKKISS